MIVIEIEVNKKNIYVISGYGPQESWPESERLPFFLALEDEIVKASLLGKSVIIQLDANSKVGSEFIPRDNHIQSLNGALLGGIIARNNLVLVNGLHDKCTGIVTRQRVT